MAPEEGGGATGCGPTRSSSPAAAETGSARSCRSSSSAWPESGSSSRSLRAVASGRRRTTWSSSPIPTGSRPTRSAIADAGVAVPTTVVAGGRTRNESTRNGLASLDADDDDVIVVHDAVRPLVPVEVVVRAIEPVRAGLADGDGHGHLQRGHAGHRRRRRGRRDPGSVALPARPDAPGLPGKAVLARGLCRRGRRRRPDRHGRLLASSCATSRVPGSWPWPATRSTSRSRPASTSCWPTGCSRCARSARPTAPVAEPASLAGARVLVVGGTNGIGKGIAGCRSRRRGRVVEVDGRSLGPRRPRLRDRRGAR